MSTQAKIHCMNCDCDYYIYWNKISKDQIISCPHCDSEIDQTMWDMIIHAMGALHDVNYHFLKYHNERNEDLFQVSIEEYYVPLNKFKD
ncbi:hypothetical protein [Clostridium botulinum]|uniref:hypothetical protein n=1 Tax=Clostridium botulinum TaxID=1491 RepID=UPI00059C7958|nr:hypothetical protein [Clostridium botulinum]KIN81951.1 hypothetical protein SD74_07225 [Clostridium botulinum]MCC5428178.1 hypothetical protein [Clostridium botulinum]